MASHVQASEAVSSCSDSILPIYLDIYVCKDTLILRVSASVNVQNRDVFIHESRFSSPILLVQKT